MYKFDKFNAIKGESLVLQQQDHNLLWYIYVTVYATAKAKVSIKLSFRYILSYANSGVFKLFRHTCNHKTVVCSPRLVACGCGLSSGLNSCNLKSMNPVI